ncbi:hypothetical protein PGTUg99_037770 [Puccinia graminis f. sp. tritici]|uniref:Uncharacterized protein n=1 Tax=Puccinia graminis f. sp. tritici TaxID=56615 RepID=A0A5B0RB11_PUCGR|nr:hypothetical protein PGTUg99_037770 [Puccinia graminis f. sp. tritici]
MNQLEYTLIDSNQRTTNQTTTTNQATQLIDHFLNHRWNSIINHNLLRTYFSLDQQHQLTLTNNTHQKEEEEEPLIKLSFIATLLSVYVQINYTGPTQFEHQPISILNQTENQDQEQEESELNSISLDALSLAGEPAYHLAKSATYLLMAIQLIDKLISTVDLTQFPTIVWWKLRAEILRRQLFDQPIPLSDQLLKQIDQLSSHLSSTNHSSAYDLDLLPLLTLERGLAEHLTGNEKAANILFRKAVTQAKLEYELTGIPGKRTKFQEKEISQLVVLAQSRTRNSTITATSVPTPSTKDSMPVTLALDDDTLMEKTQFTQSTDSPLKLDPSNQPNLHPLDQALLLALSLSIKNTSPAHGLTNAQMAPFVERVLENPNNWSIHSMALLIRSRLEAHRTRTVERGLLQLQALVDQLSKEAENDPVDKATALERVRCTWSLALPSRWELEKELGQKFSGLGLTRSAMEIFERLEMWEHVVQCHLNLDSKTLGIELVRELIEGKKVESSLKMSRYRSTRDPKRLGKLWCLLAELESQPEHWQTAWNVSQHTSSRAMRSLGAHHFMQGDYPKAKECLLRALEINPLFNKTWFIYGCAAMRTDDWDEAERAFRRCVGLDDEDAEAWNNLATVHLKKASLIDESQANEGEETDVKIKPLLSDDDDDGDLLGTKDDESHDLPDEDPQPGLGRKFSRPMAAFYALQQAVKLSYDSWRMYTNYMLIAMSVGEYMEATRALGRVVEIRGEAGVDMEVLAKLVKVIMLQRSDPAKTDEWSETDKGIRQARLFERLVDVIDRVVLPKTPTMPALWELRSELAELDGDLEAALRFQMESYRVGVSATTDRWLSSLDEWLAAIELLKRTIQKLARLGPLLPTVISDENPKKSGFVNWKWQAKNLASNFLAKSKSTFDDHPSFEDLADFSKSLFS